MLGAQRRLASRPQPVRLTKGQVSGYDLVRSAGSVLYRFRRDGAMGIFLILFWCSAVARDAPRHNSRFGVFNSRLGPNKFPFSLLRELSGKGLICLAVFAAKTAVIGKIEKIPASTGNNREFAAGETAGGAACSGADLLAACYRYRYARRGSIQ
jgi:hypothetical protein